METVLLTGVIAAGVLVQAAVGLMAYRFSERQISMLQKSNSDLAGTLGEIARVEHGVPSAQPEPWDPTLNQAMQDIYGSVPQMAFPRAETVDDPSLEADPNQLGEWDVPPGLLDAAGDEDMT